jgi:hypothetical protein
MGYHPDERFSSAGTPISFRLKKESFICTANSVFKWILIEIPLINNLPYDWKLLCHTTF